MAATKYGKYIITELKSGLKPTMWKVAPGEAPEKASSRVLYLDDELIKGAFYVACSWFWKETEKIGDKPHSHDFDEVLAFLGTNPDDPHDLCGEVEVWLGDEKHILTKSCLVFVPKGLKHCPVIARRVDRPIFHFSTGPAYMYKQNKK